MSDDISTQHMLPPLPQSFQIATALIERWTNLPERARINLPITRQEIDNLFFAITSQSKAVQQLQNCLILFSQGKTVEANEILAQSQRSNVEADNNARMFMSAIMASVEKIEPNSNG